MLVELPAVPAEEVVQQLELLLRVAREAPPDPLGERLVEIGGAAGRDDDFVSG